MTDAPLTYSGADVGEFLRNADPSFIELERIVKSIRQASAGVPRGRVMALNFARWWAQHCSFEDPTEFDDQVNAWWDENDLADDLRCLAREQAEKMRCSVVDFELSNNHPDVIATYSQSVLPVVAALEEWAERSRTDLLSRLEAEHQADVEASRWPHLISYENKRGSKHSRLFLRQRPWPCIASDGVLYTFQNGVWRMTTDAEMEAEVRSTDPEDQLDVEHVAKVVRGVHHLTSTRARPFEWIDPSGDEPDPSNLALFKNGLFDVSTGQLIPHDGRYFATGLPAHDWDPLADCPSWRRWLDETLDPAFHSTLQEWFGYCLTPDTRAHRFMTFLGGPRTGKSTAHGVLHDLVGSQHAASVMMPDLGGDFGLENLLDKRLAIVPDAHDAPARNRASALERIKSITGGDPVSVNRKNKAIVPAALRTRLLVTCNRLPKFIDESGALGARMLIVKFDRSFLGREDRGLGDRLRSETSGIANWAIIGLLRLRDNGLHFTVSEVGKTESEHATRSQSPAIRFAEDRLNVTGDPDDFTPMRDVYQAYLGWIGDEGAQRSEVRSQNDLWQDLTAAMSGIRYTQRRVDGRRTYGLSGVASARLDLDEI